MEGLIIGQGREAGEKLKLYPWQKRFLRGAFGQPDDAALSLARGGGKTTFVAGIACATLDGPLGGTDGRNACCCQFKFRSGAGLLQARACISYSL